MGSFVGAATDKVDQATGGSGHGGGEREALILFIFDHLRPGRHADGRQIHFKKQARQIRVLPEADDFRSINLAEAGYEVERDGGSVSDGCPPPTGCSCSVVVRFCAMASGVSSKPTRIPPMYLQSACVIAVSSYAIFAAMVAALCE